MNITELTGTRISTNTYEFKKRTTYERIAIVFPTSSEQPISEARWKAFSKILNRFGGEFSNSYISVTPPVKSSMASQVEPPFSASYDPCNLRKGPKKL